MFSTRKHIVIAGKVNSGKSALFNALTRQEAAIVSTQHGTTTDPVRKAAELHGFGPVVYIDTAGWDDQSPLGTQRTAMTRRAVESADLVVYLINKEEEIDEATAFTTRPLLVACNKSDLLSPDEQQRIAMQCADILMVSAHSGDGIEAVERQIAARLADTEREPSLIEGLVPDGGTVVLVVPIDSGAPKGRLILPQVQLLRDCLDNGLKCMVVRPTELADALNELNRIDLVVTDSQVFADIKALVGNRYSLTGFSMLVARQKGDVSVLTEGLNTIDQLTDGDHILIAETCTHATTHDDIGQKKLPALLQAYCERELRFTFTKGRNFPDDLSPYALVVHCGGCMVTRRMMMSRIESALRQHIPITNYGMVLAKCGKK